MFHWDNIDWILLDMDGTLLDLHFDNFFWTDLIPSIIAKRDYQHLKNPQAQQAAAAEQMVEQYRSVAGTLDWYSTDYWTSELDLPIMELKSQYRHLIRYRADALPFLHWLQNQKKRTVLVTNAHPDNLALKHQETGLLDHVEDSIVSHNLNFAKEDPLFWQSMTQHIGFDPKRTLFIDDSESVLMAAENFGVQELYCISRPDTNQAPRTNLKYRVIDQFAEIMNCNE